MRPEQDSTAFGGADHVDTPVPHGCGGRAGRGGLQGLSQAQNSAAFRGAEHFDIPVPQGRGGGGGLHGLRPGQGSSASSSMDRSYVAEGAFDGVFRTFPGVKKSAGSASQCGDHPLGYFSTSESPRTGAHGVRRLMAMALCRLKTMARGTSSRTVTRRRKKSLRCSNSPSTGSNSLAGDPDASAVITWQAVVLAGGAARLRMASKSFTRHPFLEHFVDVPVLQITDELLNEADAAVKESGEEAGGRGGKGEGGGGRGAVVLQKKLLGTAGSTPIER